MEELRKEVGLSAEDIQTWYKEYLNSLRGGQDELTREEFKRVYNSLFIGDASKFAEHVFRTFDKDGNGHVNFREFLIGLCVSGNESHNDDKLKWAFNMYDINGDGFISKDEMREIVEVSMSLVCSLLKVVLCQKSLQKLHGNCYMYFKRLQLRTNELQCQLLRFRIKKQAYKMVVPLFLFL